MTYPLITGAAGFVGARLVESFNARGIPVASVDAPAYFTERTENRGVDYGTIVDREKIFEWLGEEARAGRKPSAIYHLGACTDTTELDVEYLTKMNLEYSKALWAYACAHAVPFFYASSAATYGDGAFGYDDDESLIPKLVPLNPYGESKRQFDLWALEREKKGFAPPQWAGFKFFNVYGFGERHKEKMASVILHSADQIRATGGVKLFKSHRAGIADGHQSRDFIYVGDVVDALLFASSHPIKRGIYNLGSGRARTFLDLARAVFKCMGKPEKIEFVPTPEGLRERYQYFTQADVHRLRAQGFTQPFTTLEEGVAKYLARLTPTI